MNGLDACLELRHHRRVTDGIDDMGLAIAAGLVAREAAKRGGDAATVGEGKNCANCGAAVTRAFCAECGQPAHVHRDLHGLLHDFAHGVFHFEGRIWHTLPLLAWRPGELTRRYIHGQRARFVPPVALFLFSVFLMFTTFALIGMSSGQSLQTSGAEAASARKQMVSEIAALRAAEATAAPAARPSIAAKRAEAEDDLRMLDRGSVAIDWAGGHMSKADTGWPWLDRRIDHAAANPSLLFYKIKMSAYKFSWALIPLSLPFLWLLFPLRRDVGLYDHAIFATYSLSFMTLFVVLLTVASAAGVSGGWIFLGLVLAVPTHMYRQLRGAYAIGRFGAAFRTLALLTFSAIVSTLFISLLLWLEAD